MCGRGLDGTNIGRMNTVFICKVGHAEEEIRATQSSGRGVTMFAFLQSNAVPCLVPGTWRMEGHFPSQRELPVNEYYELEQREALL